MSSLLTVSPVAVHLEQIAAQLRSAIAQGELQTPTLTGGQAGTALFFAYTGRILGCQEDLDARDGCLNFVFDALSAQQMDGSLYTGVAGIAWLFRHLLNTEMLTADELDDSFFQEVETAIAAASQRAVAARNYDLLNGLIGYGLYYLESCPAPASPRAEIQLIVEHLLAWAEEDVWGLKWPTNKWLPTDEGGFDSIPTVDFGLAHGMPSVLCFLAEAYRRGVAPALVEPALRKGVNWLLHHELTTPDCSFGLDANDSCYHGNPSGYLSRLAWCYGDLSLAFTLLQVGASLNDSALRGRGMQIAAKTARRRLEGSQVKDAAFCHGAAGLAHMYRQLHLRCGTEVFAEAAAYWLAQTVAIIEADNEFGGCFALFKNTQTGELHKRLELGLLEGAAGIGLVLLACLTDTPTPWQRLFLLDICFDEEGH